MNKYTILKELILAHLDYEREFLNAQASVNGSVSGMSMGAIEAYENILGDIRELEKEAIPAKTE